MNYTAHYERLIERARGRVLTVYVESHHVLPRCMGGNDEAENIVELTGEEHYIAHQLLCKMYPSHKGLIFAAVWMAKRASGNKAYGWLVRRRAAIMRGSKMSQTAIDKSAAGHRGKQLSAEHRAKISAFHRGRAHSPKHRANLIASWTAEAREKKSLQMLGRPKSSQHRAKLSAAAKQRWARLRNALTV